MLKVFVSLPMNGRSDLVIKQKMEYLFRLVQERYPDKEFEMIDSFTKDSVIKEKGHVAMLGHSIQLMADADIVIFSKDYRLARGCRIEEQVAIEYNIRREYEFFENTKEDIPDLIDYHKRVAGPDKKVDDDVRFYW